MFGPDGPARIAVSVFQNDASHATVSSDEASRRCAREVADRFAQLRDAGARPGEMALLLGSMTRASLYQEALREAGLEEHRGRRVGFRPEPGGPAGGPVVARGREPRRLRGALPGAGLRAVRAFRRCPSRARHDGRLGGRKATAKAKVTMAVLAPVSLSLAASSGVRRTAGFPSGAERSRAALALARRCLRAFRAPRGARRARRRRCGASSRTAAWRIGSSLRGPTAWRAQGNFNKACVVVEELARDELRHRRCGAAPIRRLPRPGQGGAGRAGVPRCRLRAHHDGAYLQGAGVSPCGRGRAEGRLSAEHASPPFFVENIGEGTLRGCGVDAPWLGGQDGGEAAQAGRGRWTSRGSRRCRWTSRAEAERAFGSSCRRRGSARRWPRIPPPRSARRRGASCTWPSRARAARLLLAHEGEREDPRTATGDTWVTGDVFDALGWAMGEGASVAMVDFGGRAPARVASRAGYSPRLRDDEMGEGEGASCRPRRPQWRTAAPTGRGASGPTRGSSPKLRRRTLPLPSSRLSAARARRGPGARAAQLRAGGAVLLHVAFGRAPPQRRGGRRGRRGRRSVA